MDGAEDPKITVPRRKGIQSILTGFQVLDFLLKAGQAVPLRDIAAGTGLSASKLQFYLISLAEVGAVKQDVQTGHYGLGAYTLRLGIAGLQQFDIYQSAHARMEQLAKDTGATVFLGVWGDQGPTVIHRTESPSRHPIFDLRLGAVLPITGSALGRLFLAYLPKSVTADHVIGGIASFEDSSRHIRQARLSISRAELLAEHTAISAPIFDQSGRILAGITLMGPQNLLSDDPDSAAARALKTLTETISHEAGATTQHYLDF